MGKAIRIGVMADAVRSVEELISLAVWAEETGFSTLLVRDHILEEPFGHQLGPLIAMTIAATHTKSLRIGSLVLSNDVRPPVQLAKEIATLDALSGGRIELGLGAGFLSDEYSILGIPFDPPGVRVGRLEESVRLLRGLLGGKPVTFRGDHYAVKGFESFPAAAQGSALPILIAGSGDRMLRLAAREANIVGLQTVTTTSGSVVANPVNWMVETVERKIDTLMAAASGRQDQIELNTTVTVVETDDAEAAAHNVVRERGWDGITSRDVLEMPAFLIGTLAEMANLFRMRRNQTGLSYFVVGQQQAEVIAPIVRNVVDS